MRPLDVVHKPENRGDNVDNEVGLPGSQLIDKGMRLFSLTLIEVF